MPGGPTTPTTAPWPSMARSSRHHPTRRCHRLHPLSHPDLLTDGGVTEWPRTDLTGDYLTGVQANTQLQLHTVALVDIDGKPFRVLLNTLRRQASPDGVVLQRNRCPEHRHDAVAGELVYRAAVPLHHRRAAVGEIGHDLAQPLGPDGRGDVHRVDHVGEQHRDLLVLGMGVVLRDGCTTAVTESRALTRLGATHAARRSCRHPNPPPIRDYPPGQE